MVDPRTEHPWMREMLGGANSFQRRGALVFVVLLTSSCAVVDPINTPPRGSFFAQGRGAAEAAKAWPAWSAASAATGDQQANNQGRCTDAPLPPGCFAGGLGNAIDDLDERSIQLSHLAASVTNGNATYNALLYPLGAGAIYEKLRGAPNRNLLLPAVAAAALYGYVNSGVPDRERHYLRTALELQCAIGRSVGVLYPTSLITVGKHHRSYDSLDGKISALRIAIRTFSTDRVNLTKLQPKPGNRPPVLGLLDRRLAEAQGRSLTGTVGKDTRAEIERRVRTQLEYARSVLDRITDVRNEIESSGSRLRSEWIEIEQEAQRMLSERVPLPISPTQVAKDFRSNIVLTAQGEEARPSNDDLDPVFSVASRDGLDKKSAEILDKFSADDATPLAEAREAIESWLGDHAKKKARVDEDTRRSGCADRIPPVQIRVNTSASTPAQKPATSVTPNAAPAGDQPQTRPLSNTR